VVLSLQHGCLRRMKKYTRREIVGAVVFLVGFIAFFALIFTARMTMPLFYATVLTIAVGSFLGGGGVSFGDDG
jgi:hypothetical protein